MLFRKFTFLLDSDDCNADDDDNDDRQNATYDGDAKGSCTGRFLSADTRNGYLGWILHYHHACACC